MCRNLNLGGHDFQKQPIRPGGWTKPQYLFEDDGFTYIERSTGTGSPSTRCFARTERWIRRRSSFAKRPEKVNLDGNAASHRGLRLLGEENARWQSVKIRACRYLNNIVEQDHRAIKRRCASMLGLKSFRTAAVTFSGIELAHRIRKRQFNVPYQREG